MNKVTNNPRKGITIIELVIALSVIVIITVAAISIVHSAIKIEIRASSIIEANNTAESIVEIFRFSNYQDEFEQLGESLDESFGDVNMGNENENVELYVISRGTYSIFITYYYVTETVNENEQSVEKKRGYKIEIDASHIDGKQIYNETITFIKGQ